MRSHRLRRFFPSLLSFPIVIAALAVSLATEATAQTSIPPCADASAGWCRALRIPGDLPGGELGFRFGEPLDMDGDGTADIAAGMRRATIERITAPGSAGVWSGRTGQKLRHYDGAIQKSLFGHSVTALPDIDGDSLADVVISAPNASDGDAQRGVLSARSSRTGEVLWRFIAKREEQLGWDMALAGDQDGDGRTDLFVGSPAPSRVEGRVYLVSGKDGSVLKTYSPPGRRHSFGWYVADIADLDGDGRRDLLVGNCQGPSPPCDPLTVVYVVSSASGRALRSFTENDPARAFGEVVASIGDLDGDSRADIVIASPRTSDDLNSAPGDVQVFSSSTGAEIRRFTGKQAGERYGRMVASIGDVDGDGVDDLAIGAPRFRIDDQVYVGRLEIRSGRTSALLAEWVGEGRESWFGWHVRRAPVRDGASGFLVASLRQTVGGAVGTGVVDWVVFRRP